MAAEKSLGEVESFQMKVSIKRLVYNARCPPWRGPFFLYSPQSLFHFCWNNANRQRKSTERPGRRVLVVAEVFPPFFSVAKNKQGSNMTSIPN